MKTKLVLVNQASNYLTVGFANAFNKRLDSVALITGSIHTQGEELDSDIEVSWINRWYERPALKKAGSYAIGLLRIWILLVTRYRKYDVLFISVPPMGYLLNLIVPNRFSMVIWDLYPDVLKIAGMDESHWVYRSWSRLNRRSFRKAYRLFTISDTLADAIGQYVDRSRVISHPIWSIFQENVRVSPCENPFLKKHNPSRKFVVQYSGNIGVTHNVESLVEVATRLVDNDQILFQIIGRGPRQRVVEELVSERSLCNVQMLPFQSDAMFPYSLSAADMGVVILHESVSRGSVPSKAYNLMSFGIPALYLADEASELASYAIKYQHAQCFSSDDLDAVADWIQEFAMNSDQQSTMQRNAEIASRDFRRSNADRFVNSFLARESNSR